MSLNIRIREKPHLSCIHYGGDVWRINSKHFLEKILEAIAMIRNHLRKCGISEVYKLYQSVFG